MKIIIVQCSLGVKPEDFKNLWKSLYEMGKAGLLVLPEYCKLVDIVEVDENDS